jgi:hypothetical protein
VGNINRRTTVQATLDINVRPYLKYNKNAKVSGVWLKW